MKTLIMLGFTIVLTFLFGINKNNAPIKENTAIKNSGGFALVELFTSEGCSSCPPADALVAKVSKEFGEKIFVLSFHVDYWDRLGWKDKYSSPLWTKRQQEYVYHFGLDGAYTPQIVVNGNEEFVGSSSNKLYAAITKNIALPASKTTLNITAKTANNKILVTNNTTATADYKLCLALVQSSASSQVKKGENEGKLLQHINIVKDFKTTDITGTTRETDFILPTNFNANEYKIIAFIQHKNNYNILAATVCLIN